MPFLPRLALDPKRVPESGIAFDRRYFGLNAQRQSSAGETEDLV